MNRLLLFLLLAALPAFAGGQLSDAALKQKLLGYWMSPRHSYLIKSDGLMYMCPREPGMTKNTWNIKGGLFYQDGDAYQIVTLTEKKFVYREAGKDHQAFTLVKTTEKEAEGH